MQAKHRALAQQRSLPVAITPYRTRNTRFAVARAAQRNEHSSITTRNPGNVGLNEFWEG